MSKIKVISGGQSGVDQAALRAAKSLGLATGGWMPRGWLTEDGPRPEFAELYGMTECEKPGYPARTRANVRGSDMTLWFGPSVSRGFGATADACFASNKRLMVLIEGRVQNEAESILYTVGHLESIRLNCAGNRESGNPGIGERAEEFFLSLFKELISVVESES